MNAEFSLLKDPVKEGSHQPATGFRFRVYRVEGLGGGFRSTAQSRGNQDRSWEPLTLNPKPIHAGTTQEGFGLCVLSKLSWPVTRNPEP